MDAHRFAFDSGASTVQMLSPPAGQRFEGIAFSPTGDRLALATSDTNAVLLFRRRADGLFEDEPCLRIEGPASGLAYPHDVAIARAGDRELLAVAQRRGAIAIYQSDGGAGGFTPAPACEIGGPRSNLNHTDGVAFVPPRDEFLAACNLLEASITFYRRISADPIAYAQEPEFELKHPSMAHPDGLAFSQCGTWLAIANHGNNTLTVFRRNDAIVGQGGVAYGPEPVSIIDDPGLCYPHSVAFTPRTHHLAVTNAGASYFCVYAPRVDGIELRWSGPPLLQKAVSPKDVFEAVNMDNKMEGGPKGIAIHGRSLAVCSPEMGVRIYAFRESA